MLPHPRLQRTAIRAAGEPLSLQRKATMGTGERPITCVFAGAAAVLFASVAFAADRAGRRPRTERRCVLPQQGHVPGHQERRKRVGVRGDYGRERKGTFGRMQAGRGEAQDEAAADGFLRTSDWKRSHRVRLVAVRAILGTDRAAAERPGR